jgi:hypothetical protein
MRESENNHHYGEQQGHQRERVVNKEMLKMTKQGLSDELRYLIKRKMFRDRRDGR